MHVYIHTFMHIHAYTCVYTGGLTPTRRCPRMHVCIYMCTYTYVHMHTGGLTPTRRCPRMHAYIHACIYMQIHANTCIYMHIHAYTYVYIGGLTPLGDAHSLPITTPVLPREEYAASKSTQQEYGSKSTQRLPRRHPDACGGAGHKRAGSECSISRCGAYMYMVHTCTCVLGIREQDRSVI